MIPVTDKEMQLWNSGTQKYLKLEFSDGTTLENEDIYSESMTYKEIMCDESQIQFGKVSSSSFSIEIYSTPKSFKGLTITPTLSVYDEDGSKFDWQIGIFKVESEKKTANGLRKVLTCYDPISEYLNKDYSSWYKSLKFPMTIKQFRDSFFNHIGITQTDVSLPNDSTSVQKGIIPETLSGLVIIQAICELNACFGRLNRYGEFAYIHIKGADEALFPRDDLYPNDDLYPVDVVNLSLGEADYVLNGMAYEDYLVRNITKVVIKENEEDNGTSVGTDGNTYVIKDNFLTYGMSASAKTQIGQKFLQWGDYIEFNPMSVRTRCKPWIEVGDYVRIITKMNVLVVPIMVRETHGITALYDTYSAYGYEYFEDDANNISTKVQQIGAMTSKIQQDTDRISIEVSEKIGASEVVSAINVSSEKVELKGNRLVAESTNFKLDESGNVSMKGKIEATSGSIAGFNITDTKLQLIRNGVECGYFVGNVDGRGTGYITQRASGSIDMSTGYGMAFYGNDFSFTTEGGGACDVIITGNFRVSSGTKSRTARTKNYSDRDLYCYEMPTPIFGDLGEATIDSSGKCYVFIEDIFGETIDKSIQYQVFCQKYGNGDLWVSERNEDYFVVEGTPNLKFAWEIKCVQNGFDTLRLEPYVAQEKEQSKEYFMEELVGYLSSQLYSVESEEFINE